MKRLASSEISGVARSVRKLAPSEFDGRRRANKAPRHICTENRLQCCDRKIREISITKLSSAQTQLMKDKPKQFFTMDLEKVFRPQRLVQIVDKNARNAKLQTSSGRIENNKSENKRE